MISHVGAASRVDKGPGYVLRATKGRVVEAASLFLEGNRHQCDVTRTPHTGGDMALWDSYPSESNKPLHNDVPRPGDYEKSPLWSQPFPHLML